MLNRILLVITVVLGIILVVVSSRSNTTFFNTVALNKISVKDTTTNNVTDMELENYIIGVVAAEMPASFHIEALKAQAIAARTYAMYKKSISNDNFDVVTDVSNQGYITEEEMHSKWGDDFPKYYEKVKEAVMATKGQIMKYQNQIVEAYYFAMSNGYTEDVSLVFSEERDYLKSVASIYDNSDLKNFEVTSTFTKEEICQKLNVDCKQFIITNIERSDTNRVNSLMINGIKFKGTVFRSKLKIRSTDFDIKVEDNKVLITTRGYGHGVGMSQYGANGMANNGSDYEDILKYFYKNVEITNI